MAPSYGINHDMNILMLFSNLFNYLFDMQYEAPLDNIPFHLKKPIKTAVKYFNENFSEKIIVEELLKEWHVTPCNFYKYFKIYTGKTPYDYLISIRLSRSKFFLKYSDLSVNEIALKVGFNNTNNYIREFVKYYNATPKQYKISVYDS